MLRNEHLSDYKSISSAHKDHGMQVNAPEELVMKLALILF